mgnify:CR=1 FL=1
MDLSGFCNGAKDIMQVIGWFLLIFKFVIPIIIIVLGALDLGKAVTASKDDEIKKSAKALGMRIVAGIIIFLVPSFIIWIFGLVAGFSEAQESLGWPTCETCLLHPSKCK